jgi:hypothetical protein
LGSIRKIRAYDLLRFQNQGPYWISGKSFIKRDQSSVACGCMRGMVPVGPEPWRRLRDRGMNFEKVLDRGGLGEQHNPDVLLESFILETTVEPAPGG